MSVFQLYYGAKQTTKSARLEKAAKLVTCYRQLSKCWTGSENAVNSRLGQNMKQFDTSLDFGVLCHLCLLFFFVSCSFLKFRSTHVNCCPSQCLKARRLSMKTTCHYLIIVVKQFSWAYNINKIWTQLAFSCPPSVGFGGLPSTVFTAWCYASSVLAMVLCLSVCPSVTSRSSTKTANCRIT